MKSLQIHKKKIIYFLFAITFLFKLVAVHEYVHLEQHIKEQKEQKHQEDCQFCTTIFNVGKQQSFILPDLSEHLFSFLFYKNENTVRECVFLYFKNIPASELYNRPPPQVI